jgi:DNA primase
VIALVVKEVLDELGLPSYPKTSGSTGLHILTPIRPELPFPEVRRFAKALAQEVERRVDDQSVATTTWKVADREGVFVDYGQNARDRTIAAAYSIRPTPDARASAPLRWDEVAGADPAAFTLETMRERIGRIGDPTSGMWRRKAALASRFETLGAGAGRAGQFRRQLLAYSPNSAGTVRSSGRLGGLTSRQVQSFGSLSGRQRMKRVPCRKRFFSSLS